MKYPLLLGLVTLMACSKTADRSSTSVQEGEKQSCDFGISQFNLSKRAPLNEVISRGKPPKNPHGSGDGGGTEPPPPPPPSNAGVILLDFDGQLVSGTSWNTSGNISCAPANVTLEEANTIIQRITNDYYPFNITVTTDENVYNAANPYRRTRVIITESWEWYGQVGGVAFLNSFITGTNTPCFVFSSLLSYNAKFIAEAASHEAGHTIGLRHQSSYTSTCAKASEYNSGYGSGEIGWAPIMGMAYSQNLSLWHNGPNSLGCTSMQDDVAIISNLVGFRNDDYSNTVISAPVLSSAFEGYITNSTDLDFFSLNLSSTRTLYLIPYNVGLNNAGANLDLILRVYNSFGNLLATYENPATLNTSTLLAPGNYYVSVGTSPNANTSTHGMLGRYTISLN